MTVENGLPVVVPSGEWLARVLCGWHDAESGTLEGEPFPCGACVAQAEYVIEQAATRPIPPGEPFAHDENGNVIAVTDEDGTVHIIPPGWNPTPPEGGYTAEDF